MDFSRIYLILKVVIGLSTNSTLISKGTVLEQIQNTYLPIQPWIFCTYIHFFFEILYLFISQSWNAETCVYLPVQPWYFCTYTYFFFGSRHTRSRGGANGPQGIKMLISLQPNVRLTSNKAVFLSLSVVLRSMKKIDQFGPWRDPGVPFIGKGPPKSCSMMFRGFKECIF